MAGRRIALACMTPEPDASELGDVLLPSCGIRRILAAVMADPTLAGAQVGLIDLARDDVDAYVEAILRIEPVTGENVVQVVVLGARQNENLYLGADDAWRTTYIPAFVRRYPFVFSSSEDGKTFTLCVDEAFPGLNYQGRGKALFDAEGKPSGYVDNVLKFLQEYRAQFMRTEAFCKNLKELQLLGPMQAQFTLADGEKMSIGGFMVVNRAKLKALSDDKLAELARTDELELIFLHLASMRNFNALKDRLVESHGAAAAEAVSDAEPTPEAVH